MTHQAQSSTDSVVVSCPSCHTRNRIPRARSGHPRCARCKADLPWIVDAGDDDFAAVAVGSSLPVLVDIWAPWCGPCRMVTPALERLAIERAGRLKLVKVNADVAPRTAQRFDAQAIPTLVLMRDGQVLDRQVGAAPEHALRQWLSQHLG